MPRYIIKLHNERLKKDFYLEWSTVVDAPVTEGMSLQHFKEYYKVKYGTDAMKELDDRLRRVEEKGISARDEDLKDIISFNRAGKDEETLTLDEILEEYCKE